MLSWRAKPRTELPTTSAMRSRWLKGSLQMIELERTLVVELGDRMGTGNRYPRQHTQQEAFILGSYYLYRHSDRYISL